MATQTKPRRAGTSRSRATTSRRRTTSSSNGRASNRSSNGSLTDSKAARFAIPVASIAAGAIGGVILDRRGLKRRRKVLGIPLPRSRDGLDGLSKQIGEAGKQFGKLASEVRTTRQKAEEAGKAIS